MSVITISSLIRNRDWILPEFLKHLYNIEYEKKRIILHFLVNNSNDNSELLIREFKKKYNNEYLRIKVDVLNQDGVPEDQRRLSVRVQDIYLRLADLRNYVFDRCKTNYLLNIDSDILVSKNILVDLLSHKVDMVSSYIWNGYVFDPDNYSKYSNIMRYAGKNQFGHIKFRPINKSEILSYKEKGIRLLEVDLTGAVCLYSRKIIQNKKVRFGNNCNGEDHAYCIEAKNNGFKMYSDLNVYSRHIMNRDWYEKYKNGKNIS